MRHWKLGLGALALVAGLTVGPSAQAASIVARDVAHMTQHADVVVRGEVVAQSVERDAEGVVWTRTTVSVEHAYKGPVGTRVQVWQRGGALEDGTVVRIDGDLALAVGERAVLFLAKDPEHGDRLVSFLLGWSAFEISGTGPLASLRRSAADLQAIPVDGQGVLAPSDTSLVVKPPVVLTALEARIAKALEGDR